MGSLQKKALCLLFLFISSNACNGQFAKFNCSTVMEEEYSENATLSCNNNMKIETVIVKRCENCKCDINYTLINTSQENNSSERGRIFLEMSHEDQVAVLNIQKTKMSDQGVYYWYLASGNGNIHLCTTLKIRAPETEPILAMNGTELTCVSPPGHRDRQIFWFDGNGTNLMGSASLVSEEVGDSLTRVTSTLHGIPNLSALKYCCTVLYDVRTKRNKTKCLSAAIALADYLIFSSTSAPDIPERSKEQTITILVLLFLVLCSFVAVLYYKYRRRESRRNVANLIRNLFPNLQQYRKAEENQPSCGN